MKTIQHYIAPSTQDLSDLKTDLGYTSVQMADLAGVSGGNQWRKYTGGATPRELGPHYLFFLAARLELSDDELSRVLDKMREIGGRFEFGESGS
ncbi:XRE family transcriptional regulator [Castellaniella hirudinis]|uniref:XRE family transcriptional regulator n=1 Tax=Castellaniella hirudinis TaxID=1144617 RepID=UPI0039C18931